MTCSECGGRGTISFGQGGFAVQRPCPVCLGRGQVPTERCPTCNGTGEVRQVRQTFLGSMVQVTTCPTCNGTGEVVSTPCHTCRGRGQERKTVRKVVSIPAGIDNGQQIRLASEGQPGENGGPSGNLYLEIQVKPHKYFKRREDDILLNLKINVAQAALGDEIEILPSGLAGRVRGLQTHKKKEDRAAPGSRTAVNISGISTEQIVRGDVLTRPGQYAATRRVDARLRLLRDIASPLQHNTEVKVFAGTAETVATLRLLGSEELDAVGTGERLSDSRELVVDDVLEAAVRHEHALK